MEDEPIADIYLDGRHYDALYEIDAGGPDLPFWLALARQQGDPILELACGTGRVSVPLAEAGYRVTGIDVAESMLKEARARSAAQGVEVIWARADMRDFDLRRAFPLIILPANTLGHLLTRADLESCLACVRRHLAPGGRFALDYFVPKMELLVPQPGERFAFGEYDDPDGGGRVVITHSYVYEPDTQLKRITTHHLLPGEEFEEQGSLVMRMYFPQELDALLTYNGFRIVRKLGDYDGTPFGPKSEKQLIVCAAA